MKTFSGNYIANFYCPKSRLVIEFDGGQHYSAEGKEKDRMRDDYMTEAGITVVRFSDREVLNNLDLVLEKNGRNMETIMINKISPTPSFPKRGREESKK